MNDIKPDQTFHALLSQKGNFRGYKRWVSCFFVQDETRGKSSELMEFSQRELGAQALVEHTVAPSNDDWY